MSEIKVSCNDQVLKITDAPVLAAGGLNEVKVVFTFCEKWTGYVKTATFWRDADNIYFAVLDENDTCVVPWEVCYEEGTFFFGVFGEKQNSRRTSTTMRYKTKDGAISSEMLPSDPTPEVYDQIMALVAEALEHSNTISADAEKAIAAAERATADALSATESANNSATNASRAAEEANKAATAASNASNAVSTAVDNAIIATNNANNAVDRANTATNNASAAAVNASSSSALANEAARNANTATTGANNAKFAANEAAQRANNAADSANASASNAATEANRASIAASSANNAATEARAAAETATNTFNGFVEDVATTLEEIHDLVEHYVDAPAIVCESSGETVTIADASDQPLRGLKLYGKTTKDGTLKNTVVSAVIVDDNSMSLAQPVTLPGIPVSSGGNYTDANGQQWICDEMDFARGVYVQRVGKVDLGTLSWFFIGDGIFLSNDVTVYKYGVAGICSSYDITRIVGVDKTIYMADSYYGYNTIAICDRSYTDSETFKAAMSGVMLYYELATPVETPISETDLTAYRTLHTNKPNTTVYTDSNAGITVAYAADTKTYIDNKFAELAAAVLQNA